ncbi:hypothetical protein TrVE_jg4975 [Triparma verrucosa]|nr:hypothetical protein TrVE_jg4975 [Triparma verrucosa]
MFLLLMNLLIVPAFASRLHRHYKLTLVSPPSTGWETYVFSLEYTDISGNILSCSAGQSGENSSGGISNAFDQDDSTKYRSKSGTSTNFDTLVCSESQEVEVGAVRIKQWPGSSSGNQFSEFLLSFSDDGSTYYDMLSVSSGHSGWSSSKEYFNMNVDSTWDMEIPTVTGWVAYDFRGCTSTNGQGVTGTTEAGSSFWNQLRWV